MSLYVVMSYGSVLSFALKLTKIQDVLCVGTMRGRGHNTSLLFNGNQVKIVKPLTCNLCSKVHLGLLGSLRRIKRGFETMVSDRNYSAKS